MADGERVGPDLGILLTPDNKDMLFGGGDGKEPKQPARLNEQQIFDLVQQALATPGTAHDQLNALQDVIEILDGILREAKTPHSEPNQPKGITTDRDPVYPRDFSLPKRPEGPKHISPPTPPKSILDKLGHLLFGKRE